MSIRLNLVSPFGGGVVRDIVDGCWTEPTGHPDTRLGEGMWALPGLADAHAHMASSISNQPGALPGSTLESSMIADNARRVLTAGVTLILDKGWNDDTLIRVVDGLDPNESPDIEAAARVLTVDGGYFPGFGHVLDPVDIVAACAEEAEAGVGWVKLIGDWPRRGMGPVANFTEDQMRLAVVTAEKAGSRVAIHTMAREVPSVAVAAGVHSIEHGLFLSREDVDPLGARGGMWVPTLLRVEATLRELGAESSGGRLLVAGLDNVRDLLPLAVEAGVRVLAGTDLMGSPANIAAEALKLAEYGLRSSEVVAAVSTAAFVATGRDEAFAVRTQANAVLFPANPIEELEVLATPSHVIRRGCIL